MRLQLYRINVARNTDLLIIVGTSGATTLPNHIAAIVAEKGSLILDINLGSNVFSQLAVNQNGFALEGSSADILPEVDTVVMDWCLTMC